MDSIEFYFKDKMLTSIASARSFQVDDLINIQNKTYRVVRVTYALDQVMNELGKSLRCNVDLVQVK